MRLNDNGGYDVAIKRHDGRYLQIDDSGNAIWTYDADLASTDDTDDDALMTAAVYGLTDDDGELGSDYTLAHIFWVNDELADDPRFYDNDRDEMKYDAIRRFFILGRG